MNEGSDCCPNVTRSRTFHPRPGYSPSTYAASGVSRITPSTTRRLGRPNFSRRRFRPPYYFPHKLVKLAKQQDWFATAAVGITGRQCIPVELKVRILFQWAYGCCCRRQKRINNITQTIVYMVGVHVALNVLVVKNRTKKAKSQS